MSRVNAAHHMILILLLSTLHQSLMAQSFNEHVVSPVELQVILNAESSQRRVNIDEVRRMLNHQLVQKEVGDLFDLERIEVRLAALDDETLARLAEQSREVSDQVRAGVSSWVIIIAVSAILLVILLLI